MLNTVEARTDNGLMLALPFDDISSGYLVQGIDGLDPVPANIVSTSFARLDGEQYQSARREKRNLILKLGLEPDYTSQTVSQLRNNLYRFFMPRQVSNFRFYSDDFPIVDISGRVETFDCPLFVKEPVATISVLCFDPDFYEPVEIELSGNTTASTVVSTLDYEGTVDTGIVFRLMVNRTIAGFTIEHTPEGQQVRSMVVSGSFIDGDIIEISTVPGNKYATLTRSSVVSSVLYTVSPYSDWTRLQPGNNGIRVYLEGATIPYTITYTNKHGGL
jgi:hypothetical protein